MWLGGRLQCCFLAGDSTEVRDLRLPPRRGAVACALADAPVSALGICLVQLGLVGHVGREAENVAVHVQKVVGDVERSIRGPRRAVNGARVVLRGDVCGREASAGLLSRRSRPQHHAPYASSHTLLNSSMMYGTLEKSAPEFMNTTTRPPASIICPSVGQAVYACVAVDGVYTDEATPEALKAEANAEGARPSELTMRRVITGVGRGRVSFRRGRADGRQGNTCPRWGWR